ncbi:MAG: prolyl-tRNA synthetase associated domain-containing protein [Burkholderiales bacterium]
MDDLMQGADAFCAFLGEQGVAYERLDHPAVFTADEADRLVPKARGAHAKNLLVEDRKSGRLFMLTVPFGKRTDLKATAKVLGTAKLSFASAETMLETLGVTPGAVSMMALINDRGGRITLVLDRVLAEADAVQCHPLVNTATLIVDQPDLRRFLAAAGHAPQVLEVPAAG